MVPSDHPEIDPPPPSPPPRHQCLPFLIALIFCSVLVTVSMFPEVSTKYWHHFYLTIQTLTDEESIVPLIDVHAIAVRRKNSGYVNWSVDGKGADVYTVFHGPPYTFPNTNGTFSREKISANGTDKIILIWKESQHPGEQSSGSSIFSPCPVKQCALTTNHRHFKRSAAVIFFAAEMACGPEALPQPNRTSPDQLFIYAMGESPINGLGCGYAMGDHFFNWTMTYRLDSDIRAQYTYQVPLETKSRNFASKKSKLVAWFVSHCKTDDLREKYVTELRKFIQVDVYGKCGNLTCTVNVSEAECLNKLKNYKFYLSFENSMCKDYVTEKMVHALEYETVPIVYGDGNYRIFPPKSYIHVYDYPNPAKLADYLLKLDQNDTLYNEYMEWRYQPKLVKSEGQYSAKQSGFCQLCKKLHSKKKTTKSYPSIVSWWVHGQMEKHKKGKPVCRSPSWLFNKMVL